MSNVIACRHRSYRHGGAYCTYCVTFRRTCYGTVSIRKVNKIGSSSSSHTRETSTKYDACKRSSACSSSSAQSALAHIDRIALTCALFPSSAYVLFSIISRMQFRTLAVVSPTFHSPTASLMNDMHLETCLGRKNGQLIAHIPLLTLSFFVMFRTCTKLKTPDSIQCKRRHNIITMASSIKRTLIHVLHTRAINVRKSQYAYMHSYHLTHL